MCQDYSSISLDTLNKYDENSKKTGYWVEFLKKDLRITNNKKKVVFFRYVLYQYGKRVSFKLFLKPSIGKKYLKVNGNEPEIGKIILLNGTYSIYLKKGDVLLTKFVFKKGNLSKLTGFDELTGQRHGYIDFENRYKQIYLSYLSVIYDNNIETKCYFVFENGRWHPVNDNIK
jgi:hypothetical protein